MEMPSPSGLGVLRSMTGALKKLEGVCRVTSAVGMGFFLLMVLITAADVFLRYFFSKPLSGTVEITEFFMVIVFFTSVAYAQWTGGHIVMDVVTAKLSERARRFLTVVTTCWSVATVGACLAAMARYALNCELYSPTLTRCAFRMVCLCRLPSASADACA